MASEPMRNSNDDEEDAAMNDHAALQKHLQEAGESSRLAAVATVTVDYGAECPKFRVTCPPGYLHELLAGATRLVHALNKAIDEEYDDGRA